MSELYDVAIIGAGSAGLAAVRETKKQTESFVLIHDGPYGTTCARVGCMPSKALIEAANAFHRRSQLEQLGIRGADQLSVDIPAVLRRVRSLRDEFVAGILPLTGELGARSVRGRARFVAPDTLEVEGRRIKARSIVIATGSRPIVPSSYRELGPRVLTSDTLFEQETLPKTMAVIGAGAIGAEIAQALARLGVAVTVFSATGAIAALTDPQVNEAARAILAAELTLQLGHEAQLHEHAGRVRVTGGATSVVVDSVLAALGRTPNTSGLGLETLGVPLDQHGMPAFDRHSTQVADPPVFIAGDVSADLPVLHVASDEGFVAGRNAAARAVGAFRRRTPISIVFCDPNVAVVGKRYGELELPQASVVIGSVDFARQGRARIAGENRGLLHVYAQKHDGRLLGAEMCAPRAEHLAHLLALAIERELTVHQLLGTPFYHPVFEEGLRSALRDAARQLSVKPGSDLASCDAQGADALD